MRSEVRLYIIFKQVNVEIVAGEGNFIWYNIPIDSHSCMLVARLDPHNVCLIHYIILHHGS